MSKTLLRAALALAAEDFGVRPPPMPTKLGRGRTRRRNSPQPAQVGVVLKAAIEDQQRGIYYAWPFLTGTRPSEQLAVLWDDSTWSAASSRSAACRSVTASFAR